MRCAHAHQQGVIHRDVKPSNLLIDAKGSIWVTDFGLARRLADPGITHHDSLLGTPRYMSPEQARTGTIDGRTDVYSLGATLYELLDLAPSVRRPDGRRADRPDRPARSVAADQDRPPRAARPGDDRPQGARQAAGRPLCNRGRAVRRPRAVLESRAGQGAADRPAGPDLASRAPPSGNHRPSRRTAAAIILAIATFAYLNVVSARDHAEAARAKSAQALDRLKELSGKERAANKENLRSTIELVGLSGAPSRRSQGIELVGKAASLDPRAAGTHRASRLGGPVPGPSRNRSKQARASDGKVARAGLHADGASTRTAYRG